MISPLILGLSGTSLTTEEIELFKEYQPYGFIIFSRNVDSSSQIIDLTSSLKSLFPDRKVPIFIDQEGGRVARMKPPVASQLYPAAKYFGAIYQQDKEQAKQLVYQNFTNIMQDLQKHGIDSPCGPNADILYPYSNQDVVGDRSFGEQPDMVAELSMQAIKAINDQNSIAIIKHLPGHGRATIDSHFGLPVINATLDELQRDIVPFQAVRNENCWGMAAHIIYKAIDPDNPITFSKKGVEYIRNIIGFQGTLTTDSLDMLALHGEVGRKYSMLEKLKKPSYVSQIDDQILAEYQQEFDFKLQQSSLSSLLAEQYDKTRSQYLASLQNSASKALEVGFDYVMQCSGDIDEMRAVCRSHLLSKNQL